ncbi:hypothetical protein EC845_1961 [Comamonas sp. BIGb0124]|uniref:DUF5658 family protein n=1 Tax=Comamonas sp. BIGb0124 TaxID=2485130 RepID=UPI000F466AD6|nr:DUF5658 family protein [Comamonas sp. BIGb0124]ROR23047.1 hypothetical protein EC845_1961 [Comamonas sp. BIGb0124]
MIYLYILLCVLNLADIYTTQRILGRGGSELNPLMAKLFARVGVLPGLLLVKIPLVAGLGLLMFLGGLQGRYWLLLLGAACAVYLYVLWHNLREMRKQR